MLQKHFQFENLEEALSYLPLLQELLESYSHQDALLLVLTSGLLIDDLKELEENLKFKLKGVKLLGASVYKFSLDLNKPLVEFNLLLSKSSDFKIIRIPCSPGEELEASDQFRRELSNLKHLKAIQLFTANTSLNVTSFLQDLSHDFEDIPIFGAVAKPCGLGSDTYVLAETIFNSGFAAVAFSGESLEVYMDYILGWNPIGREMTVSLGAKKSFTECAVSLIDNRPAIEIYQKYLGITWEDTLIENIWAFPLMVRRNGVNICYIPTSSEQGTLYFNGTIYDGEKIRFSYCTREEILNATLNGSKKMEMFGPEAIFITLCGNRVSFLQKEAHLEWDFYKQNHPDLAFYHGHGEISLQHHKGGLLNSAFVAVGLREGPGKPHLSCSLQAEEFRPTGQIPLSYLVSHFFHEMTHELVHFQHHLEAEVERKTRENTSLSLHVVKTLAEAIDAKDTYTKGHSARVAKYAKEIAKRAAFNESRQDQIYMIGLLHDVGKIGVPDEIINKPGRLTDEEYAVIKTHPVVGAKILQSIEEMPKLVTGARWHHERFDGRGYPDGLKGEEIPEEARIIAVADAYDAMTSNRSYRKELAQEYVRAEMVKGQGSQFDPRFAKIMVRMIDEDVDFSLRE
ncbi:MAG: HD domain-containing protein [Desulfovibrionaceae bacterium]|nr:HD domain-containing protein [Desulfovibrionaceae bacterium]